MNEPLLCISARVKNLTLEIYSGSAIELGGQNTVLANAANKNLQHLNGIAGDIANRGGPAITEESQKIIQKVGQIAVSKNAVTSAGRLNFAKVIHAVGPQCPDGVTNPELQEHLIATILNIIKTASSLNAKTVVIPLISGGSFGFPVKEATFCHVQALLRASQKRNKRLTQVKIALFTYPELHAMIKTLYTFLDTFSYFRHLGTREEHASHYDKAYCRICDTLYDVNTIKFKPRCCRKICEYCIWVNCISQCNYCQAPFSPPNPAYIICRDCDQYKDNFHDCKQICYDCLQQQECYQQNSKCRCGMTVKIRQSQVQ